MKRMVSGIKPSGTSLTLGNYIGAIKEFVKYQNEYELLVFVADLHALTVFNDPAILRESIKNLVLTYLAAGIDYNKITIFKQSDIYAHNQLEWVLTCNTKLSELTKMPQYKKYQSLNKTIYSGILLYPSLMSADILLYDADFVPVGKDQVAHIDLTRDIATKLNLRYGNLFKLPEALVPNVGYKIMSLSDPTKKMSKSESDAGTIFLFDTEQSIRNKIKKAKTDSENKVYFNIEQKPGISNLITIYSSLTNKSIKEVEELFKDINNYGIFKEAVADIVVNEVMQFQERFKYLEKEIDINQLLLKGKQTASSIANKKIETIYKTIGLI